MKNICFDVPMLVAEGATFSVNLEERNLVLNGKFIIKNGECSITLGISEDTLFFPTLHNLYRDYKYSVPTERSKHSRKCYFKALTEREMPDEAMLYGYRREEARARLEIFVLCCIINGMLKWDEETMGKWFWQSEIDKDLIILRKWVDGI